MKNVWIWAVVIVVVIGGGYWYWQGHQAPAVSDDGTPAAVDVVDDSAKAASSTQTQAQGSSTSVSMTASVTYNGSSFSPSEVTIKKGGTVTFTSTAGNMWVASAPHPAHTGYDGTSRDQHCAAGYSGAAPFDQCASGTSFTFTFDKTGTWPYHNHLNSKSFGKVVVQ